MQKRGLIEGPLTYKGEFSTARFSDWDGADCAVVEEARLGPREIQEPSQKSKVGKNVALAGGTLGVGTERINKV